MKERPILFSGAMVRALLDGTKTQTRRLVKPQPVGDSVTHNNDRSVWFGCGPAGLTDDGWRCPCGVVGDRLWLRETFCRFRDGHVIPNEEGHREAESLDGRFVYRASYVATGDGEQARKDYGYVWTPSIHMPRRASRITLEVTDVRVQRLQDISEEDARAEGVTKVRDSCYAIRGFDYDLAGLCHTSPITPFQKLWDSINGEGAWDANPWVWAISFKRVTHV